MKLVINTCFGGFSISPKAMEALAKRKGKTLSWWASLFGTGEFKFVRITLEQADITTPRRLHGQYYMPHAIVGDLRPDDEGAEFFSSRPEDRADPDLVAVVEELGEEAAGEHAELKIVEIPDGVEWEIDEYDGREHIAEKHQTWS